jgi:hypothetical protein
MAGEVVAQSEWFKWSLNQLSREFGIARETVQSRLRQANIEPSGDRRGHPVYGVANAAKAILIPTISQGALLNDPDRMSPKERADWYKGENDRLKFEKESGFLVVADQSREQMALIAKSGLQILETLPDILERDFSIDPKVISSIEEKIDVLRDQWADILEHAD